MSKDKKDKKEAPKDAGAQGAPSEESSLPPVPDGFDLVTPEEGQQTWFRPSEGAVVHGRLLGRFEKRSGRKQAFFQIKLKEPAAGIQGKGDDAKVVELGPGDVLNVNETKTLEDLRNLVASDGVYDVHITVVEKLDLDNGNTFWKMRVAKKTLKAPTFAGDTSGMGPAPEDDIPF